MSQVAPPVLWDHVLGANTCDNEETFTVRQLELVDLTGTVVQHWQTPLPEEIPVSGLAEGMYVLRGIGASEILTQRVVVAH